MIKTVTFEWDAVKNQENVEKHGVSFAVVEFFKEVARKNRTQYQKMIRKLLDEYVHIHK